MSKTKLKSSAVSPVSLASMLRPANTTLDHTRLRLEDLEIYSNLNKPRL